MKKGIRLALIGSVTYTFGSFLGTLGCYEQVNEAIAEGEKIRPNYGGLFMAKSYLEDFDSPLEKIIFWSGRKAAKEYISARKSEEEQMRYFNF